MEKLIMLLNEYENWKRGERTLWGYTWWMFYYIQSCDNYLNLKIISKEYWFIKRLVDNDKIKREWWICPRKNLVQETIIEDRETHKAIWRENKYTEEEQLLMFLSIQDNPIEDLISYLK